MYKILSNFFGSPLGYVNKSPILMRLAVVIALTTVLQIKANAALAQKVNLNERNTPLVKVFNKIKAQSGYDFIYNEELVNDVDAVNVSVKDASVEQAVAKTIQGLPLDYVIKNNVVVIKRKVALTVSEKNNLQIDTTVSGIVLEAQTKLPIVGASISVKGTKIKTQTDVKGRFLLTVPKGAIVVASFVGFAPQEIISDKRNLIFSLTETVESMKEVVINGLFTRKAETYTGATTTFSKAEIERAGNVNLVQSLANLDPAFVILDNLEAGSDPNVLPNLTLRGATGLPDFRDQYGTDPNQPLFILDGFQTTLTKVLDIDMTRVKSVTLLKDAASKAIYGAQAANGVVVIETEKPTAGKLRVSYTSTLNIQAPDLSSYDLVNAAEKLEIERLAGLYTGATSNDAQRALDQQYAAKLFLVKSGVNADWMSKPLRSGIGQRHSLGVSGGDQAFLYNVVLSYNNTKGAMKGSDRNTFTGNIDLNYRAKSFNFRNQFSLDLNEGFNSPWGSFSQYAAMNPYLAYSDANGNVLKTTTALTPNNGFVGTGETNPAYNAFLSVLDENKYTLLTNNFSVDWKALNSLRVVASVNLSKQLNTSDKYLPADHTSFISYTTDEQLLTRGSYVKGNGYNNSFTGRFQVSYSKLFNKHSVTLNTQAEANSQSSDAVSISTQGFPNDRLNDVRAALTYAEGTTPSGSESASTAIGASVSGNYSWDNRAIADLSYRTNASSQYGANGRWGNFWSAGIGWNFHNEEFIKKLKIVNNLQVRASRGYTGSQGFGSFMSLSTYTYNLDNVYNGGYGASISNLANPDLEWQRRYDNNAGISIGLWRKFNIAFDYYLAITNGLVTSIDLPPSIGWTTVTSNLGSLENKGFDFRANYRLYSNPAKKSSLTLGVTASRNSSTLKKLASGLKSWNDEQDNLSSGTTSTASTPKVRFIEGQSMNTIWAVRSLGIDPASGNEVYLTKDGNISYTWSAADQVAAGQTDPDLRGNFNISWQYKSINVNAIVAYKFGGQMYNTTLVSKVENADLTKNVDRRVLLGRWRNPGDISFYKNIASTVSTQPTTRFVEDDNTLTLSSLNVSYDFNDWKRIKALGITRLRATAGTSNLFEWASTTIERGTAYPFARTLQLSLNANF